MLLMADTALVCLAVMSPGSRQLLPLKRRSKVGGQHLAGTGSRAHGMQKTKTTSNAGPMDVRKGVFSL